MAYKNVKNVALSTNKPQTLYQHIRDFLTATGLYNATTGVGGWTALYNYESVPGSVSLNDWCLLKTTGEDGTWDFRVFMKVTSLGIISYVGAGIYNTSTNNPSFRTPTGTTSELIATPANWTAFYLYADKNFCAIVVRAGTTNYVHRFGILNCVVPAAQAPQQITGALTSGANKVFHVADSNVAGWTAGNRIMFLSWEYADGGGYMETSVISANDTGTDNVTVLSNSYAYPIGTWVSQTFPYMCDYQLSKSLSAYFQIIPAFGSADTSGAGYLQVMLSQAIIYDSVAPNPFTGGMVASLIVLAMNGTGGNVYTMPDWCLITKKRSIEEELHTDGVSDYRYFSYYNETTYTGYLFKEV